MSAKMRKIVQSVLLAWFLITSVIPTMYLSKIPLAHAASVNCIVGNTSDTGPGSFRACINTVNLNSGHDYIYFSATGTINMAAPYLALTDAAGVTISGTGAVTLNGSGMSGAGSDNIMVIQSSYNDIKGLTFTNAQGSGITIGAGSSSNSIGGTGSNKVVIINSTQNGIYVDDGADNTIQGTYIGTDGSTAYANGTGILLALESGDSVTIGGTSAGSGCVISGNTGNGIQFNSSNAGTVSIIGNYIGLDSAGTTSMANGGDGIEISSSSGTATIQYNTISGNSADGISIASNSGTLSITGNKIGTSVSGKVGKANTNYGININASSGGSITIGADSPNQNLISGNGKSGVYITGSITNSTVTISGNYIGTDVYGVGAISNTENGILVESTLGSGGSVVIGNSSKTTASNVISGNTQNGISASQSCQIYSSYIGLNAGGTGAVANTLNGISVTGSTVTIGNGSLTTGYNVISGNTKSGISVSGSASSVTINGNYIGSNPDGTSNKANVESGIALTTTGSVTIGSSSSTSLTNVISGNSQYGINSNGPSSLSIYSSTIGTNAGGTGSMGNSSGGIILSTSASSFTIGNGSLTTGYNVISGNSGTGLLVSGLSSGTGTINGNFIGMGKNGSSKVQNQMGGIEIKSSTGASITIGSSSSSSVTNILSGNGGVGLGINSTNSVAVYSSIIGSDQPESCETSIGNGGHGISAYNSSSLTIGNTRSTGWNVIGNNAGAGILINGGTSSTVKGNFISTDRTTTCDIGNTGAGIQLANTSGNTIGGTGSTDGNIIMNSDSYGINISGAAADLIRGNLIYQNGTPATPIYISTPGDWNVSTATFTTTTTSKVAGTLTGFADGTTIDVYSGNDASTPSLMRYEGSTTLASNAFALNMDFQTVAGTYFYITAVDTTTKKTSQASSASAVVTADSTAPADITVTSATVTNNASYTMTGTKEAYASVENNGSTWVAKSDSGTTWSQALTLSEGSNSYNLCSVDYSYNRSGTGTYTITLDTSAPAAPTLSYSSFVSTATAQISVYGEASASIYINGVDSGVDISGDGFGIVSVSLTANTSNTFFILIKDAASNSSSEVTATIQGNDVPSYGGSSSSSSSSNSSTTSTTDESEEQQGTDELAGEDEAIEENYEEEIEEPDEDTQTEEQENLNEEEIYEPPYQGPIITEEIYDNTAIITYQEPLKEEGDKIQEKEPKTSMIEVTINKDKKPQKQSITSTLFGKTDTDKTKTKDDFMNGIKTIADEVKLAKNTTKIFEQIFNDTDQDNISDTWEQSYFGDTDIDGTKDTDRDGLTNGEEFEYALDPTNRDSDSDGLSDMIEIYGLGTDPNSWDTDGDGISDVKETFDETSPTEFTAKDDVDTSVYGEYNDSDSDGMSDYIEAQNGTDPYEEDTDGDGLTDSEEVLYNTNPNSVNQISAGSIKTQVSNITYGKTLKSTKTILMGTSTPNSNVIITIMDLNNQPVLILESTTDGNGIFAIYADKKLVNGSYKIFVISLDKNDNVKATSDVTEFNVDDTFDTGEVTPLKFNDTNIAGERMESKTTRPKITGKTTKPGTRVNVTWKSFVFTSVLMSDSITGEFTVEAPEGLESGDHTVYFYPVDPATGVQGETMMVDFTLANEVIGASETTVKALQEESEDKMSYLSIAIVALLLVAGGYVAYKKSSRARKAEKKLIDKL